MRNKRAVIVGGSVGGLYEKFPRAHYHGGNVFTGMQPMGALTRVARPGARHSRPMW